MKKAPRNHLNTASSFRSFHNCVQQQAMPGCAACSIISRSFEGGGNLVKNSHSLRTFVAQGQIRLSGGETFIWQIKGTIKFCGRNSAVKI